MTASPASPRHSGFTLLELVLSMLLLTLIVGMVFGTAKSSLQLGNAVVTTQNEEMLHQAFFEFMGKRLSSLPGNTRFDLKVSDSGTHYLSDLTLQNAPMNFDWGGQTRTAKAVQLSTVKRRSGYLDIVLRYYENDIIGDDVPVSALGNKPFAEITLLQDVLGLHQDAEIANQRLRRLVAEHGTALPPETIFALGEIAERYRHDMVALRKEVPAAYARTKSLRPLRKRIEAKRPVAPAPVAPATRTATAEGDTRSGPTA